MELENPKPRTTPNRNLWDVSGFHVSNAKDSYRAATFFAGGMFWQGAYLAYPPPWSSAPCFFEVKHFQKASGHSKHCLHKVSV